MKEAININELAALLTPFADIKKGDILVGGLTNSCVKLTSQCGLHYLWRGQSRLSRASGLCRYREFNILQIAAKFNLTVAPVVCLEQGLLTSWIEGKTLTLQDVNINLLARILTDIHQIPSLVPSFDPFKKAQHYFEQIIYNHAHQTKAASLSSLNIAGISLNEISAIHHYFQARSFNSKLKSTLVHCDLGYYNLIMSDNGKIAVIDWEFAGLGCPAFDIVMAANANFLPISPLLSAYCQQRGIKQIGYWLDCCLRWQAVADNLAFLWYILAFQIVGDALYQEQAMILYHQLKQYSHHT